MKNKGILWWLKRKKEKIVYLPSTPNKNTLIKKEEPIEKEEEKDDVLTLDYEVSKFKNKEKEIIRKDNERPTILKPKKVLSIDENNEKEKINIKKAPKEKIVINKSFIDENKVLKDIEIEIDTIEEIEKLIKQNYIDIQNIKYELEIIETEEEEKLLIEEIEELIEKLNQLIKQFEEIKKDFYSTNLKNIYDHATNNDYISQLIEEYKISVKEKNENNDIIHSIKQIEEYIFLINDIIDVELKKDEVNKKLDDKKEELELNDKDFDEIKEKYNDIEKVNDYIESFTNEYDKVIIDIETKLQSSTEIIKKVEYKSELVINYNKLFNSVLLLSATPTIAPSNNNNLLKLGLMFAAIRGIKNSFRVHTSEKQTTTHINITNYSKEITASITNINNFSLEVDKAKLDIKEIKKELEKEFSEYIGVIKEYTDLLADLDSIEKEIDIKANTIKEYNSKLEASLEENNIKIKRLEN